MRYDAERKTLLISAETMVSLALRRREEPLPTGREEEGVLLSHASLREELYPVPPSPIIGQAVFSDVIFEITAHAAYHEGELTYLCFVEGDPAHPKLHDVRFARGLTFLAAYLLCESGEIPIPSLRVRYVNPLREGFFDTVERPSAEALRRFFDKLLSSAAESSREELDRVIRRLPTMAGVKFPFSGIREGQHELIRAVYRTVRRGERLYACAPTGIGKTISTLFPAVRAMGDGYTDKIFYLTAKNTTAAAACEACEKLAAAGADIRVLHLVSKERICRRDLLCREQGGERCPLSRTAHAREDAAARDLFRSGKVVITERELREMGEERKLCPYELSLRYAELADIVICDYNYLFDPRIALRRFFSSPKERYTFLIDEAHNLVERSRELYSAEVSLAFLERFRSFMEKTPENRLHFGELISEFKRIVARYTADAVTQDASGIPHGFSKMSELPPGLPELLADLLAAAEAILDARALMQEELALLRTAVYDLRDILDRLSLYSKHFTSFLEVHGDALTYRSLCLDPSEVVASRLSLGSSAVLFSATFTPTEYYRTVLGGERHSDMLDLPSPFDPSHLAVAVLDKISTRYTDREESLGAVARSVLTAVKAKPGNYLIFCPSFAYMDALVSAVLRLAPNIPYVRQERHMSGADRRAFLDRFSEGNRSALLGFSVLGGIFGEGIDLVGRRLIGSIVIGVGLPQPTPEREAIAAYYEDTLEAGREYAYLYPGINRVWQAAGRVIRRDDDRGVILLIDDRYGEPTYREMIPNHFRGLRYVGDLASLTHFLKGFWSGGGG